MCVIIIKQNDKQMSSSILKTASKINPHGLGVVFLDNYEMKKFKSSEYKVLKTKRPFIAHFRFKTKGVVSKANTHPFVCGNNTDELLMHNGTISGYGSDKMTDSEQLAIELGNYPRRAWKKRLAKYDSRFVAINTRNRTFEIFNKHLFTRRNGVWYSKANVLQDNLVAVYGTLKRGEGNYHLLRSAEYLGRGKTAEKFPLVVSGLPYLYKESGVGYNVEVDVFKVSDQRLARLDQLESHPKWYKREQVNILVKGKQLKCWVYFMTEPRRTGYPLQEKYTSRYTNLIEALAPTPFDFSAFDSPTCTQLTMDYENGSMTPYCTECFNDLKQKGNIYECTGCGAEYEENEVEYSKY
jgi:gamma-glutamylcyclotransferase (GGCT)/AIG2-like uncharacterized protein YtfP